MRTKLAVKLTTTFHPLASIAIVSLSTFARAAVCTTCLLILSAPTPAAERQTLRGHVPAAVSRSQPVERLAGERRLNLAIGLPLRDPAGLSALLQQLYDPASPNYHHWLTPAEFTTRFGPTEADYHAVAAWAAAHRLNVAQTHPNRVLLDVEGAAGDIEKALRVRLHVYRHPTEARTFYAPDAEPSLDLAVPVLHISGLETYALPRPRFKVRSLDRAARPTPKAGSGPSGTYMANDFRAAYVPDTALTGTGQAVGLLQFDGYAASDIAYYIAANHLSSVTISNVLLDGFNGTPSGTGGEVEACLDIEMVLSMAPGVKTIYVYEAGPYGDWHDILNRMANDNLAKQLSCSWYIPGGTMDTAADQIFQQMAAQGQSFFSASGDDDAYCGLIDFPGDTPYITQVGGTTLSTSGPGGARTSEQVWNWNNDIGSGGGISTQYPIPSWQQGISMVANHGSTTMRNTPDVALTADQVYVRADGADQNVGGTSAAAPLWAGFCALVNQQAVATGRATMGFLNPLLYAVGQGAAYGAAFHDITLGNNTNDTCGVARFPAVSGYDLATGWGTPSGQAMIDALAGSADPLQISPGRGFTSAGGVGGPFTVTSISLTLTNAGTNALTWSLVNTSLWLDISASGGTLTPGGPATILTVGLDSAATNLALGNYSSIVWFTNLSDNVGQGREFDLAVIVPPAIVSQPTNQTVLDGAIVTLAVGVSGGTPLSYQWQANSNNLTDGGHISGSTTATLTVSNVGPSDAASYQVVVTNAAGMAISSNAVLVALPGNVDHFAWAPIASPQPPSFPATLTALDPANVVATSFSGSANLSATTNGFGSVTIEDFESGVWPHSPWVLGLPGTTTGTLGTDYAHDGLYGLNDPEWVYRTDFPVGSAGDVLSWWVRPTSGSSGRAYLGFGASASGCWAAVAAPNTSQFIIQYDDAFTNFNPMASVSQTWQAAKWYKVAVQFAGGSAITASLYDSDGVTLLNTLSYGGVTGLPGGVAIRSFDGFSLDTVVQGTGLLNFPITPTVTTPFVKGSWSGIITALQIGTNVTLKANDDSGHAGFSNPFDIVYSNQPPLLMAELSDQTVASGVNVTLAANAAGSPPLSYFWFQDGALLSGATGASYTTNDVPLDASGSRFSCLVSNAYGTTNTRTATLTVLALPPAISQQPSNLFALVGASATFNVAATGSLPLSYSWQRDGLVVPGATASSYTTNNVQVADSGARFSCLISNAYGTLLSSNAVLTVLSGPTGVLTTIFAANNGYAGNMFDIAPKAPLGISALDVNIGPAGLAATVTVYYRVGTSVGHENSSAGWVLLDTRSVTAAGENLATHVDLSSNDVQFLPGQTYGLYVYVNFSAGAIMYYTDGSNTYENADLKLITNCGKGDPPFSGGTFSPRIWNGSIYYGPTTPIAPLITAQPTDQTVPSGASATFTISASGTPPLSYWWLLNGMPIPGATNASYTTNNVLLSASGSHFSCVVSNTYGTTNSRVATLTVVTQAVPVFLSGSYLYLPIQTNGVFLAANTGAKFNTNGTGGASGVDFWEPGTPVYNTVVGVGGTSYLNGNSPLVGGFTGLTVGNFSTANMQRALISGVVMPGLNFSRDISFATDSKVIRILDTLQNSGTVALTNVVTLDTTDPDQDYAYGYYETLNDVVSVNTSNDLVVATGPTSGLSVGFGSDSGFQIPSAVGFNNTDAYGDLTVVDPNGASDDVDINLAQNYGTLAAGQSQSVVWYMVFGASMAEVLADFSSTFTNPPTLLTQPADQTVASGASATFTIDVLGTPPLNYAWLLNGSPMLGATNASWTTNNVPLSASGSQFSCVVTNAYGTTNSQVATLTVLALPPTITQQPSDQVVLAGSNATFSVLATGSLPLSYQWRSSCDTLAGATNASLTVPGVTTNQLGCAYWVEVTNAYGAITSAVATLEVVQVSTPDSFNPGANGIVYCTAVQADGKVLVGGGFTTLGGQSCSYLGRVNADGTLDTSFNPGASSYVYSLAVQPDGKILVGGSFTMLGGQSRYYLGRLNSDGTLDTSFNPGASGSVYSLAVQPDGKILVGGSFTMLGGQSRYYLGRLNANGTLDTSFNCRAGSVVDSLAVQPDGKILVGGSFTTLGGQSRACLGRLNADGTLDTSFNPGASAPVFSLAVQADGKILVGGVFTTLGGQGRNYLGRLNADGTLDTSFNPGASGPVFSLAVQADGDILAGGYFTTLGGQSRYHLGRLNADGTVDTGFNPGANNYVFSLAVQADGKILVGGSFTTLGGQSRYSIGRLTATGPATQSLTFDGSTATWQRGGSSPEVWRTVFEGSTNGTSWMALGAGTRIADGWQLTGLTWPTNASLRARGFVAGGRYNGSGWFVETLVSRPVIVSQPSDQTVASGASATFTVSVFGTPPIEYTWLLNGAPIVGATNASCTTNDVPLSASGSQFSCLVSNAYGTSTSQVATLTVLALPPAITQQPSNQMVLAGTNATFSVLATGSLPLLYQWRSSCDALDDATNASLTLPSVTTNQSGGTYWVEVTNAYGAITSAVATLEVVQVSTPDSFNPVANGSVYCTAVQTDGKILVGGDFTTLGGQSCSYLGRVNADGTLDSSFNPGVSSDVYSLAVQADGKILLGGDFTMVGGQSCSCVGRVNADGTLDTSFNPGANGSVFSLAVQADGKILMGGYFTTLGGQNRYYLGRVNADGTLDTSFNPGANSYVYSLAVQADGKILVGGDFYFLCGQSCPYLGRVNADGTLDANFNPGANSYVYSLAVQADGKILVGGSFTTLGGQSRYYLGRLNADGTLDASFDAGADSSVCSLVLQTDGKILVGGFFTTLGGESRSYLGRVNADGTLDNSFNPGASSYVYSLAVQADGSILVGGYFTTLGAQSRSYIGRLTATEPATQSLTFDGATITWQRGGSSPEVWRTVFEGSTNGTSLVALGAGTRITGGWQLTGLAWPTNASLRARGFVAGGWQDSSGWLVETTIGPPVIVSQPTSQTVVSGTSATFTLSAWSAPPFGYSWLLNGDPIPSATNTSYVIGNVPFSASGSQFSCVVSNAYGTSTSQVATLTVLALPPTITQQPSNQMVLVGSDATFSVLATGSLPLSYQWRSSCDVLADATNSSLTLPGVDPNQSGCTFWVEVANAYGAVTSAVTTLEVVYPPSGPDSFNPGANGSVNCMAVQADGKILVGGAFTTLGGQNRSYLGRLNADGTVDTSFDPGASGWVYSLVVQADGKILVGGSFITLGGQNRYYLARLNADGTLDASFNPGADATVYSLVVQADGKILVGGYFTTLCGQSRSHLGRLNADGTLDVGFNPGADDNVFSLAVQADGKILAGGSFATLGGQSRSYLGRINADGTLDASFNPGPNSWVFSLAVQADGRILLGGDFYVLGGQSRYYLGRVNADGTLDTGFNPGTDGPVFALAVQANGEILVGGYFATLGGQSRSYLGRLNADGTLDSGFNPEASSWVYSLAVQADGRILVGGEFRTLAGQWRYYIGRLTAPEAARESLTFDGSTVTWQRSGSSPEAWRTFFDGSTDGTSIVALGAGTRIAGGWQLIGLAWPTNASVRARGFVAGGGYNDSGWFVETVIGLPMIVSQPTNQTVPSGASATFTMSASGSPRVSYAWLLNGAPIVGATSASFTTNNVPLSASGSQFSCVVSNGYGATTSQVATLTVLALPPTITQQPSDQAVLAGSDATFSVLATGSLPLSYQWRSSCGALADATNANLTMLSVATNQTGCTYWVEVTNDSGAVTSAVATLEVVYPSTPDSFNPVANGSVYCTAVQADGKILVGGSFTTLCGQARSYVGRLNADGTLDTSFNPGANSWVYSLTVQADGKILVGGWFTTLGGQSRSYLGRLNADGTLDTGFNPGASYYVNSLAVQADGKILVGGYFTTLCGQGCSHLGRVNADGTLDTSFDPGADSYVFSLAVQADGRILVGGSFTTLGGQSRSHLGRLNADGTVDASFNPGASSTVGSLALQADGKILVGGSFTTLGGQIRYCLGRLNADGTADTDFNPGANGSVNSLAVQADGRILVGGDFSLLGGRSRSYLGRVNADGTLDASFTPEADGTVFSLAVQADGSILVGGSFATLGDQSRYYIGRLTATAPATQNLSFDGSTVTWQRGGSSPEVWRTEFEGSTNGTDLVALGAGTRIAGGWQITGLTWPTNASLRARGFVAGGDFNGSGWFVETLIGVPVILSQPTNQVVPSGYSATFTVCAIGAPPLNYAWLLNGTPIAGATNTSYTTNNLPPSASGSEFSCVVSNAYGTTTSQVATLTVLALSPTMTQQPSDQAVWAGSNVTFSVLAAGSLPLSYQWRSTCGTLAGATSASLTLPAVTTNQSGCTYWVEVTNVFGAVTSAVATLVVVSPSTPDPFNPVANEWVYCVALQADGKILVGGGFGTLGGQSRSYLGRVNADGTLDTSFNPGADSLVDCLAVQADGKVLVAGAFTTLGGQSRSCLGRLNADGTLESTFNPGASSRVHALAVQADGKILVGGEFTMLGGQSRSYLGRLNADGTLDTSFNPGANDVVYSLAVQADGRIVVGGDFTTLGGRSRSYLGRLNADGTLDTSFNPGASGYVYTLAVQADGKILVGGDFSLLGGQSRSCLGRVNADGTVDTTFNPGASSYVYTLAVQTDGRILVGGYFTILGGQSRDYLGRLNADGTLDPTFNPGAGASVYSLAVQVDGRIVVGGYFTTLGGQSRSHLGRLTATVPATQSLTFDGSTVTWRRGGSSPEVWRTVFEGSTNGTDVVALGAGTRIAGGWQISGPALQDWPTNASLRACGFIAGGNLAGSAWLVETRIGPPVILGQPTNQTVASGASATFVISTWGTQALSYSWLLNGTPLIGATNASFTTNNVPVEASGSQFSCLVSNAYGTAISQVATLTVLALPPTITQQPASVAVTAGSAATFSVAATGSLPLSYFWQRNGAPIAGATLSNYTTNNVQLADSGTQFSCLVSNAYGTTNSIVATLTVLAVRPVITQQPTNQTVSGGATAGFRVSATGTAPLSYQWQFNGTNLADTARISGSLSNTLTISNAGGADAGSYDVVVTNAGGSVTSIWASLIYSKAPATVILGNLLQRFDGTAKPVSTATAPPGLRVDLTYNGSVNAPTSAGSYTVAGTINDPSYQGSATNTLRVINSRSWTQISAPGGGWVAVASSADGTKLVAAQGNWWVGVSGLIYTSTDSGATWTPGSAPEANWAAVACSADGTTLVAAQLTDTNWNPGAVYTSTNSGATWTGADVPSAYWAAVACSADGTKVVAAQAADADGNPGSIYTSSDGGATWSVSGAPSDWWASVAASADGGRLIGAAGNIGIGTAGLVYTSTNSGATWAARGAPNVYWASVASSADGGRLVAVPTTDANSDAGWIYMSTNSGTTWTQAGVSNGWWASVACSGDGTKLVAAAGSVAAGDPGPVYTSLDSGATWAAGDSPIDRWAAVAASGDGNRMVAASAYGGIYVWWDAPAPPRITVLTRPPGGIVQITITGSTGDVYRALASTNLLNWQPIATVTNFSGTVHFSDPGATNLSQRFYRCVMP